MKIVSWNLLYRQGAAAADIARIIERQRPDLFLMQEATEGIDVLPSHAGGHLHKLPWEGKSYALGAWVPEGTLQTASLELPFSRVPGKFPPRVAQVLTFAKFTIVNVHLSHGQLLNRRQLRKVAKSIAGPLAIIGDFNTLGPIVMRGFEDVGPRRSTHRATKVMPFRLDRCLVRDLKCTDTRVLERGRSDHHPIVLHINSRTVHATSQ